MGILALKTLAKTPWTEGVEHNWKKPWHSPVETYDEARTALRWALSRPVTAWVSHGHAEFLWWMIEAEKELRPLMEDEENTIAASKKGIEPIFPRK
jgi:hypothetical protein